MQLVIVRIAVPGSPPIRPLYIAPPWGKTLLIPELLVNVQLMRVALALWLLPNHVLAKPAPAPPLLSKNSQFMNVTSPFWLKTFPTQQGRDSLPVNRQLINVLSPRPLPNERWLAVPPPSNVQLITRVPQLSITESAALKFSDIFAMNLQLCRIIK